MGRPSRFSPEVRERAVRMVEEHREAHASEWAVLQSVAPKLGCTVEALRKWVRQAQRDAGHWPGLTKDCRIPNVSGTVASMAPTVRRTSLVFEPNQLGGYVRQGGARSQS